MLFDLRIVVIAASFIVASIAVAAAGGIEGQASRPAASDGSSEARPIRVVLPAPWEPATPAASASGPTAAIRK